MCTPLPLLTIAIPTFNRKLYLSDLIVPLIHESEVYGNNIELLICDNCSDDGTDDFIRSLSSPQIRYIKNNKNIGGDANFLKCIDEAKSEYIWLLGDDELLNLRAIANVMDAISRHKPSLIILNASHVLTKDTLFSSYKEVVDYFSEIRPIYLLEHTLISLNVFHKSSFDLSIAKKMKTTNYGHMYGLITPLKKGGCVFIFKNDQVIVREVRAPFHKPLRNIIHKHVQYLLHIADHYHNEAIAIDAFRYKKDKRNSSNFFIDFIDRIRLKHFMKIFYSNNAS